MKKIQIFLVLLFLSCGANALQKVSVKDGGTYHVKMSLHDQTRVAIEGYGRIDHFRGDMNLIEFEPDKDNGEIYIRPKPGVANKAMSYFVSDDNGSVYTLVFSIHDVPAETVMLVTDSSNKNVHSDKYKSSGFERKIKTLIKAMALNKDIPGYEVQTMNVQIPLWEEAKIALVQQYSGELFNGNVYVLKNVSEKQMILDESEFQEFGKDVKAAAIEKAVLSKGEITAIYVVRGASND